MIIFRIISPLVLLIISLYLFDVYKVHKRRNQSTLYWAIGFSVYTLGQIFSVLKTERLVSSIYLQEFFTVSRFILLALALLIIYAGVVQLITQSRIWKFYLPVAVLILVSIWSIYGNVWLDNTFLTTLIYAILFQVPVALLLSFLFGMLFSLQLIQRQGLKGNMGPLILNVAFISHAIESAMIPWILDTPQMAVWSIARILTFLLILWGLVRLGKDAERALDHKFKIHGLKKSDLGEHELK